jgi:hypothetical protein
VREREEARRPFRSVQVIPTSEARINKERLNESKTRAGESVMRRTNAAG